jgi:hypothetical protein
MWQLDRACERLNRITCKPLNRVEDDGKANIGHYYWQSHAGGFALCQVTRRDGAWSELLHAPTGERLYSLVYAFAKGVEAARFH